MKFLEIEAADGTLKMAKIVKGADYFGTDIPEDQAFAMMDRYVELGGNTIDTARIYGKSNPADPRSDAYSEGVVGRWLRARGIRNQVVLVTKGAHPDRNAITKSRISKEVVAEELEKSLSELQTDRVDVYFLHRDNPEIPAGEIIDMLNEHVAAGRIRALGASNWTVDRIDEANAWAEAHGKAPFSVSQIQWGLAVSTKESWGDPTMVAMDEEQYAGYLANKIPVMGFSSQGGGYYSKLLVGQPLKEKIAKRYDNAANRARLEIVRGICGRAGLTPAELCMAYITCNPLQGAALIGCTSVGQVEDCMAAADLTLDEADLAMMWRLPWK